MGSSRRSRFHGRRPWKIWNRCRRPAIEPPRAKDGRLTLHLRVSGQRERAIEMVRGMEHSKRFASPRISGENTENAVGNLQAVQDTGKVSFDVLAEYNPPTLDERK